MKNAEPKPCIAANSEAYTKSCECEVFWITRRQSAEAVANCEGESILPSLWMPLSLLDVMRQLAESFGSKGRSVSVLRLARLLGDDPLAGLFGIEDFIFTTNCRKNLRWQSSADIRSDLAIAQIETQLQVPIDEDEAQTRWDELMVRAQEGDATG